MAKAKKKDEASKWPEALIAVTDRVSPHKTVLSPLVWVCAIAALAASVNGSGEGGSGDPRFFWTFAAALIAFGVAFFGLLLLKGTQSLESEHMANLRLERDQNKGDLPSGGVASDDDTHTEED